MRSTKREAVASFAASKQRRASAPASLGQAAMVTTRRCDRSAVLRSLNDSLAAKLLCVLRYRRHHFMARGLASQRIAEEFLVHADEELAHADQIAERIVQLGGEPDFSPETLSAGNRAEPAAASSVVDMVRENLATERIAIDACRALIDSIGEEDPTTRRMLEGILAVQEAHADELLDLLQGDAHDP